MRTKLKLSLELDEAGVEAEALKNDIVLKWTEGKTPKKVIIKINKIINIVI